MCNKTALNNDDKVAFLTESAKEKVTKRMVDKMRYQTECLFIDEGYTEKNC